MISYQIFKHLIFRPLVLWGFRARIEGVENIPASGGAVLAMNHIAAMDSVVVPAMMPREMFYPAKAELFRAKGPASWIVGGFLRLIGTVPMERGGGRASSQALAAISVVLAKGNLIGIYPEGTRSADGRLYKGHTGVARLAVQNSVPVIPIGLFDTRKVKGLFGIPWVRRPRIVVGKPLHFSDRQPAKQPADFRIITDEVMAAIQELTGQEYVDVYGTRAKHGDLKGQDLSAYVRPRPGTPKSTPPAEQGAE